MQIYKKILKLLQGEGYNTRHFLTVRAPKTFKRYDGEHQAVFAQICYLASFQEAHDTICHLTIDLSPELLGMSINTFTKVIKHLSMKELLIRVHPKRRQFVINPSYGFHMNADDIEMLERVVLPNAMRSLAV